MLLAQRAGPGRSGLPSLLHSHWSNEEAPQMGQGQKWSEEQLGQDSWRLEMASAEFGGQTSCGEVSPWSRVQKVRCSC